MNNRLFLKSKLKTPVIITLQLEADAAAFFTTQRKAYFPAHINYLDAHLTLFHALPPEEPLIEVNFAEIAGYSFSCIYFWRCSDGLRGSLIFTG